MPRTPRPAAGDTARIGRRGTDVEFARLEAAVDRVAASVEHVRELIETRIGYAERALATEVVDRMVADDKIEADITGLKLWRAKVVGIVIGLSAVGSGAGTLAARILPHLGG